METKRGINSDYSNNFTDLKNCYLVFNSGYSEDSAYSNAVSHSKMAFDSSHVAKSEICYEAFWIGNSSWVFFSSQIEDSYDIYFSKNLRGCNDCFGCVNLRNKSYYIFNEPYSKEEYAAKMSEWNSGSYAPLPQLPPFSAHCPAQYYSSLRSPVPMRGGEVGEQRIWQCGYASLACAHGALP